MLFASWRKKFALYPVKIYTEFNKKCACINETAARNLCNERLGAGADTGGCRRYIPPTRPKEVLTCMGAIWWVHGGRVPPTFSDEGDIICHVPPLFSL